MKPIMIIAALLVVALLVSALLLVSSAHAMDDKQFDLLKEVDQICMRRVTAWDNRAFDKWDGKSFEKGFERCADVERQYVEEYQRRQAANVGEDKSNIDFYFQLYPPRKK